MNGCTAKNAVILFKSHKKEKAIGLKMKESSSCSREKSFLLM